jgi:hypothetical protein
VFAPSNPFQPGLMFVGKVKSQPERGSSFRYSTWVGYSLSHTYKARLERLVSEKHSSLLRTFVNYERKKFYNFGPRPPNLAPKVSRFLALPANIRLGRKGSPRDKY